MKDKVLIWGLGVGFEIQKKDLLNMIERYNLKLIGVAAKASEENKTAFRFYCKEEINPSLIDYIIVTTGLDHFDQIKREAVSIGFKSASVISTIDLKTCDYKWTEYLENGGEKVIDKLPLNFSLFAQNCCGGLFYHSMGRRFMSPLINTFLGEEDFIQFASNISHFLSMPLELAGWENGIGGKLSPYFRLDSVLVHFPHVYTEQAAVSLWENRKERVSLKNDDVGILMFTSNESSLEKFAELPYYRKVCVVDFKNNIEGALYVDPAKFDEENLSHITMAIARGKYSKEFKRMLVMMGG